MFVLCVVGKCKMEDNQDKETEEKKIERSNRGHRYLFFLMLGCF